MKATELMVGDWVKSISPCKILSISEHRIELYDDTPDYDYGGYKFGIDKKYFNDIKPIPLTAEILEKNGFKTNNDHTLTGSCIYRRLYGKWDEYEVVVRLLNGWLKVRSYDERWYDLLEVHFQPRYVHELQRVLRCCGLWDLAENFKI